MSGGEGEYVVDVEIIQRQVSAGTRFTAYDTNMTSLGTLTSSIDLNRWECVEGSWLIDRTERTTPVLRYATLSDALEVTDVREIPVGNGVGGGFVEHLVIGADASRLVVISTVDWTPATLTAFTIATRAGELLWQATYNGSQHITGFSMTEDGWLLSGIDFARPESSQFLWLLNYRGWPQQKQHYYDTQSWEFVVQNNRPPRLLHQAPGSSVVLYDLQVVTSFSWWDWLEELFYGWLGDPFVPPTDTTYWASKTSPPSTTYSPTGGTPLTPPPDEGM